jgi:hypothetical protein
LKDEIPYGKLELMDFLINRRQAQTDADSWLTARFARGAEIAEGNFFLFAFCWEGRKQKPATLRV